MPRTPLWIAVILFGAFYGYSDAAMSMTCTISSQTISFDDTSFDVFATYCMATPSPAQLPNGTIIYMGPYSYRFNFWRDLPEGADTSRLEHPDEHTTDRSVHVSWRHGQCEVQINGVDCLSCQVCDENEQDLGATTLSADCTNIPGGRVVDCEPALIFYPLVMSPVASFVEEDEQCTYQDRPNSNGGPSSASPPHATGFATMSSF